VRSKKSFPPSEKFAKNTTIARQCKVIWGTVLYVDCAAPPAKPKSSSKEASFSQVNAILFVLGADVFKKIAVAKFGERGILDTIGLMGHYSLIGMLLNTARTPVAPGGPPLLERFPR
jgi:hypothetical protein